MGKSNCHYYSEVLSIFNLYFILSFILAEELEKV